jgi:MFS family permease
VTVLIGLTLLVGAVWLPTPSLAAFLGGGVVSGLGGGLLFRGTVGTVGALAPADSRAEALAGLFLAGYAGLTVPVIGLGLLDRYATPQVGLLVFAGALTLIVLTTAPTLLHRSGHRENGRDSVVSNSDRRPGHKADAPRTLVIGM